MIKKLYENKKLYKSNVIRVCDICGEEKVIKACAAKNLRLKNGLDRCWRCSQVARKLPKGERHGLYKHGLTNTGYKRITTPDGSRMLEHRYLAEKFIGRKLSRSETIHHIDFNKINNRTDNFYICSLSEHRKIEDQLEKTILTKLYKIVWFDSVAGKYTLERCTQQTKEEPLIKLPPYAKKIHIKKLRGTPYCMYLQKRHCWKRYHILVIETHIGRRLNQDECVHHIDRDTLNNSINNLCLLNRKSHKEAHSSLRKCAVELYKKGILYFKEGQYHLKG